MKYLISAVVSLLVATHASATVVLLSGSASVHVEGDAQPASGYTGAGSSYSMTRSVTGSFASFNRSLNDSATAQVTGVSPIDAGFLPTTWTVSSQAAQTTFVNASGITMSGNLSSEIGPHAQIGSASAAAQSGFDITFRVDEAMAYTLTVDVMASHGHGSNFLIGPPTFSLTALGGALSLNGVPKTGAQTWNYDGTGVLAPGDYRLIYNLQTLAFADPLGDFDYKTFSLGLNLTSVPDPGTTLLFLAISLGVMLALRRPPRLGEAIRAAART